MSLKCCDFDYTLPADLIAQRPASRRDASRLLVVDRRDNSIRHTKFSRISEFLKSGDVLVLNNTRVMRARLKGRRRTGGQVEVLLLKDLGEEKFKALIKPLGRLKVGEQIVFGGGFSCRLLDAKEKIVSFDPPGAAAAMEAIGLLPLPPYVKRTPTSLDRNRYQTVFADREGAVAAPTAGLHFTRQLLTNIKRQGVEICFLTLHVNYATFSPVRNEDLHLHRMEDEFFEIPAATVSAVRRAKREGRRVFCVGTTVCKALEDSSSDILDCASRGPVSRASSLFIYPPFNFRIADVLITNFHLPRTTLLMLVAAYAGRELILEAYREAVRDEYRFYSYGDAMLIL